MQDVAAQLPNSALAFSSDAEGQIGDLVTQFWNDPDMSPQEAAELFADIVASEG